MQTRGSDLNGYELSEPREPVSLSVKRASDTMGDESFAQGAPFGLQIAIASPAETEGVSFAAGTRRLSPLP